MAQTQNDMKKTVSKDLLSCGTGKGIQEKLLLKCKRASPLQTERIPRSSVLDRLQSFLPQMAQANESLIQKIEEAPAGFFDIESVEDAEKIIEMDVALVELENSDSSEESSSEEEEEEESSDDEEEEVNTVTAKTLKLPGNRKRKANIQVLEKEGD